MESRNKEINTTDLELEATDNFSNEEINAAADDETAAFSHLENNEDQEQTKKKCTRFFKSELFTKPFKILCGIFGISVLIYVVSRFVPAFAEFWTRYPAQGIRFVMAKLTGWIPFSLAECIIVSLPVLVIAYIVTSTISTKTDESDKNFYRWMRPMISILLAVLSLFLSMFGPAYGRYTLDQNLSIERKNVSAEELYETATIHAMNVSKELSDVSFDLSGASVMPYDYNELKEKVNAAFEKYASCVDYVSHFKSNPKPIALSEIMTYTHISGVYTFMTGESNINSNYPDFLRPFTMAHEMAHQRGIAREDEANFVAFLVCIGSDDAYLRYSGYTNMINYMLSAISKADMTLYAQYAVNILPAEISKEFVAYSAFFDKYRESVASEVTGTVNNTFLQSQGQKAGTKSYGLVVELAVAYYKQ